MYIYLFSFLLFFITLTQSKSIKFYDGLINSRVQSSTYLTSALAKTLITVEVKNEGKEAANEYIISISKSLFPNLSFLEVLDGATDEVIPITKLTELKITNSSSFETSHDNAYYYYVPLPKILLNDQSTLTLKITIGYIHVLEPLPAEIKKGGKQYMVYENNRYFYSPYYTNKLNVKYTLPSDKIKSYTKPVGSIQDKKISYGPYGNLPPLSESNVRLHFQYHAPFLTVTQAIRDIEVSHWGNVRMEESFELKHDGAKMKGPFEPGLYDRLYNTDPSAIPQLKATLPLNAHGVYYVDRIGNISTSNFRTGKTQSYLEIKPRYPLYGGWKTDFTIGYDVPSQDLITIDSSTNIHTLNISFDIPFKEPVVDILITKIALPEGAFDVEINVPFEIEELPRDKRFTYLDSRFGGGRPLVTLKKNNVANLHHTYFQVNYKYEPNRIYSKPIALITGFLLFFTFVIIAVRISPSLEDEREQVTRKLTLLNDPWSSHSSTIGSFVSTKLPKEHKNNSDKNINNHDIQEEHITEKPTKKKKRLIKIFCFFF